jgi:hypothetical protein
MSRPPRLLPLLAALLGCAHPKLAWGERGPEDPSPSGPAYLRDYKELHYRELGEEFVGTVDWHEFDRMLDDAEVLWLGDHHEDETLHDRMLETVARIARVREIAVGLEAYGVQDEALVARFLAGDVDLAAVREAIRKRWPDSWLSHPTLDAPFYAATLELARDRGLPVFALEPTPRLPLAERDAYIASRVRSVAAGSRLVVVVVGHTHLLGKDKLVDRCGATSVVIGARMSRSLRESWARARATDGPFLATDTGVLFFNPPPGGP